MIESIILIVLGALAASTFIVAKQPNAKAALDKLAPAQGILGVIAAVWGLIQLVRLLINIRAISIVPMYYLEGLAVLLLTVALGFLMGYGLIAKYALSGNVEAATRGEQLRAKLVKFQTPLGLAGIAVGVIGIIMYVVH